MLARRRVNRQLLTGSVTALYMLLFSAYIWMVGHSLLTIPQNKIAYSLLTLGIWVFAFLDRVFITKLPHHSDFNWVAFSSAVSNLILIIFIHLKILTNPVTELILFNGLIFANTIIVLICMKRHGLIND